MNTLPIDGRARRLSDVEKAQFARDGYVKICQCSQAKPQRHCARNSTSSWRDYLVELTSIESITGTRRVDGFTTCVARQSFSTMLRI
jgi:hypothetical protein